MQRTTVGDMPQWIKDDLDKLLDEGRAERITRAIEIGIAVWIAVRIIALAIIADKGG